jgi:hypothetical protein
VDEECIKEEQEEEEEDELEGTNPCSVSEDDVTLLFSRDLARLSRARDIVNYDIGKFKGLVAQGTTVKARIPGSFAPYYRVSVSLAPQQIERVVCYHFSFSPSLPPSHPFFFYSLRPQIRRYVVGGVAVLTELSLVNI